MFMLTGLCTEAWQSSFVSPEQLRVIPPEIEHVRVYVHMYMYMPTGKGMATHPMIHILPVWRCADCL